MYKRQDQDPRSLAEAMVEFNETYDYDFIKMMPFGAYTVSDWGAKLDIYCDKYKEVEIAAPGIECREDYKRIQPLPAVYGTWGKVLQLSQWLERLVKPGTPYIQTIFSPATTLKKLAGNRMLQDMLECPELVHGALAAITETTINFVKANIEAGVSGFFFAKQCASYDFMGDAMFAEFNFQSIKEASAYANSLIQDIKPISLSLIHISIERIRRKRIFKGGEQEG